MLNLNGHVCVNPHTVVHQYVETIHYRKPFDVKLNLRICWIHKVTWIANPVQMLHRCTWFKLLENLGIKGYRIISVAVICDAQIHLHISFHYNHMIIAHLAFQVDLYMMPLTLYKDVCLGTLCAPHFMKPRARNTRVLRVVVFGCALIPVTIVQILQDHFTSIRITVQLLQCQWSNTDK